MRVSRLEGEVKADTTCNKLGSRISSTQYEAHMSSCNNRRPCEKSYLHPMLMSFHVPIAPWTLGVFPGCGWELILTIGTGSNPRHYLEASLCTLQHLAHLLEGYFQNRELFEILV